MCVGKGYESAGENLMRAPHGESQEWVKGKSMWEISVLVQRVEGPCLTINGNGMDAMRFRTSKGPNKMRPNVQYIIYTNSNRG